MARNTTSAAPAVGPAEHREAGAGKGSKDSKVHVYGKNESVICDTDPRGRATPDGKSPTELVLDTSNGFIPLWAKDVTLQWRFRDRGIGSGALTQTLKAQIRTLFGDAVLAWADSAPVKFTEDDDLWDFEIVVRNSDDCRDGGCVLASAFFPDPGRHQFYVYPKMFTQDPKEQVDTFIHEIGHVFGLRHFFANLETGFPSTVFGVHNKFTIMNYGANSELTSDDKADLKHLYQMAWSGNLAQINGTPIRFMRPFHTLAEPVRDLAPAAVAVPSAPGDALTNRRVEASQQLLQAAADILSRRI